jgi:hypothetical protein
VLCCVPLPGGPNAANTTVPWRATRRRSVEGPERRGDGRSRRPAATSLRGSGRGRVHDSPALGGSRRGEFDEAQWCPIGTPSRTRPTRSSCRHPRYRRGRHPATSPPRIRERAVRPPPLPTRSSLMTTTPPNHRRPGRFSPAPPDGHFTSSPEPQSLDRPGDEAGSSEHLQEPALTSAPSVHAPMRSPISRSTSAGHGPAI